MTQWENIKDGEWVSIQEAERKLLELKEQLGSCQILNSVLTELSMKDTELMGCKVKLKKVKKLLKEIHETIHEIPSEGEL